MSPDPVEPNITFWPDLIRAAADEVRDRHEVSGGRRVPPFGEVTHDVSVVADRPAEIRLISLAASASVVFDV